MITIHGRLAKYGEIWFDDDPPPDPRVDILRYRLRRSPLARGTWTPFRSLVSDLSEDADTIMSRFGGTNRYKIKRADSKDGLKGEFITRPAEQLANFCDFYDGFAAQKKLPPSYRRGLRAACAADKLVLSAASHAGVRIVWHAYVRSGATAALLHSASHYRVRADIDRAVVGRANRWLHWQDMLAFRAMGVFHYDCGGLFDDESVSAQASVNNFKREFGGRTVEAYNCTMPISIRGRLYTALRSVVGAGESG
jgi:hypothetical protein